MKREEPGELEVEVRARLTEAEDVVGLMLVRPEGGLLPSFEAGSHIDVRLAPDLMRQYSLCNDPAQRDHYRLGILLVPESRGGSALAHQKLAIGSRLRIGYPRNNFRLEETAGHSVLLAGGIGITPLLAMSHRLWAIGKSFEIHYCARERRRAAYLDLMGSAPFSKNVVLHFDDGPASSKLKLDEVLVSSGASDHLYVCGPPGFISFVLEGARRSGWPETRLHSERFSADAAAAGDSFTVIAIRSGLRIFVAPNQTIRQALQNTGIEVEVSCEQGVCGTYLTRVIDGVPDHRDVYQTDEEKAANENIAVCCSRAHTPELALDL